MSACEVALQKGEYYGGDLGDYVGVKRMDTEWFAAPADSKSTRVGNAILGVVLLVIGGLTLLGFGTAISFLLGAMA